jgi:hypothetical protein
VIGKPSQQSLIAIATAMEGWNNHLRFEINLTVWQADGRFPPSAQVMLHIQLTGLRLSITATVSA